MIRLSLVSAAICSVLFAACSAQEPDGMTGDAIAGKTRMTPESMAQVQLSYAPVVDQAAPAVVNIFTKRVTQSRSTGDPFFDRFFRSCGTARADIAWLWRDRVSRRCHSHQQPRH